MEMSQEQAEARDIVRRATFMGTRKSIKLLEPTKVLEGVLT